MKKTIMNAFETFLEIASSKLELARFLSDATGAINKTTYKNGRSVYKHIDGKGLQHYFSQCPNGTIKESVVEKGIDALGKKTFNANVIYYGGALENAAGKTTMINNKLVSGNINVNGGNFNTFAYAPKHNLSI